MSSMEPVGQADKFSLIIGEIGVTPEGYVVTPNGNFPIRGTRWVAHDMSQTRKVIPTYAIVLAILLALFFLLGLLFLLIREERTDGWVQVSVTSPNGFYASQIPVFSRLQVQQVFASVGSAQMWAARAN